MLVDFHSHSTLSDGALSIEEAVAAAERRGYTALAITDHAYSRDRSYRDVAVAVRDAVDRLRFETGMYLFAGVELTDFEPTEIAAAAEDVRNYGTEVVAVHGECVTMDVLPGTNAAAVRASGVDILGHPGLLAEADADAATRGGVYVELSARQGHCYGNGHVYATAHKASAPIIVDSDGHDEDGLLTERKVLNVLQGAGASQLFVKRYTESLAPALLRRFIERSPQGHKRIAS